VKFVLYGRIFEFLSTQQLDFDFGRRQRQTINFYPE
jgi:hypothetical protein